MYSFPVPTLQIMQYGARFFYWWFMNTDPAAAQQAFKLYKTTQLSRKAFRMLKVLDEIVKLKKALMAGRVGGSGLAYHEALQAVRSIAMGFFWTFDNLNYLTTTDTIQFGNARALRGFSRSWSVGSALLVLLGVSTLRRTQKKRSNLAKDLRAAQAHGGGEGFGNTEREKEIKIALSKANAEHFKSWLTILKGVLDLTCAVNISGVDLPKKLLGHKLNDGIIGAIGCVSALCVLYNSWPNRIQPPLLSEPLPIPHVHLGTGQESKVTAQI
ncbi:unnamed protein product [Discosporangium mesarthrocarpum]